MASLSPPSKNDGLDNSLPHPRVQVHDQDEKPNTTRTVYQSPIPFHTLILIYYSFLIGCCIVESLGLHDALTSMLWPYKIIAAIITLLLHSTVYGICLTIFNVLQPGGFILGLMAYPLLIFALYVLKITF